MDESPPWVKFYYNLFEKLFAIRRQYKMIQ
jgi:hypothetical protein